MYDNTMDEGLRNNLKALGKTFWNFRNRPTDFRT